MQAIPFRVSRLILVAAVLVRFVVDLRTEGYDILDKNSACVLVVDNENRQVCDEGLFAAGRNWKTRSAGKVEEQVLL